MQLKEAVFRQIIDDFRERAARHRRLASLLEGENVHGPMSAFADELERWVEQMERAADCVQSQLAQKQILLAEIDAQLAAFREAKAQLTTAPAKARFSTEDLREEARICAEEARAASSAAYRRALAARVAYLEDAAAAAK